MIAYIKIWLCVGCVLICTLKLSAQDADTGSTHAGYIPAISGGLGYIYNVNGGIPTLLPQINPLLLVPFGSHVLLESRTDFTGFFQRREGTSGDYTGQIFKTVEFAQVDWLANTHVMPVVGKYILPFGLYPERLTPLWIANIQDTPFIYPIGTRTSGAGIGGQLRGVVKQTDAYSVQYAVYYSAHSNVNQLSAARTTGFDASIFLPSHRIEVGTSYQRYLDRPQINSGAGYLSWQPPQVPLDLKAQYSRSFNGQGYWIEGAYMLSQVPAGNSFFRNVQLVGRMEQLFPLNGGGNGLPTVNTQRAEFGLNYYFRDNWRFVSSYGRQFTASKDLNLWNVGFTYRFLWPLWPERK
jgi:hypothetical protein